SEPEVTEQALSLAEHYASSNIGADPDYLNDRSILKQHVGYYLLDDGYEQLTQKLKYKMPIREKVRRKLEKSAIYYLGTIGLLTLLLITLMWLIVDLDQYTDTTKLLVLLTVFFPFLDFSISATNRFYAFFLPPRILSKMKFDNF